jgi:membrane protein required for colicin V production
MELAPYDMLMLGVLAVATLIGFWKGFAWQVASLAAIVGSYFVAYWYREPVAAWIPLADPWRMFGAMFVLYVGSSLAIWCLFRLASGLIDRWKLKDFDRQLGAVLGLAKGLLLCAVITFFSVTLLGEQKRVAILQSRSGYALAVLLSRARQVIPQELSQVLQPHLDSFMEQL